MKRSSLTSGQGQYARLLRKLVASSARQHRVWHGSNLKHSKCWRRFQRHGKEVARLFDKLATFPAQDQVSFKEAL